MTRLAVAAAVLVVGFGGARLAHADRADQLFKKGKKLLAEKKYPEACNAFEESDKLDPAIGSKLNVAHCYEEWGKLATAWRWYSEAAAKADADKDERAKRIHKLVSDLDANVPRLTVLLPKGAVAASLAIKLDGVDLPASALGAEQRVDPGLHRFDYLVDNTKQTKVVSLERGASSEITLDVPVARKRPVSDEPSEPVGEVDRGGDPRQRRLIGMAVGGAGVVAIGIASIVTLRARGDYKHALDAHCSGATDQCDAVGLTATHSARHRANISTVFAIGGLAAVAGGAYLYLRAPNAAGHDEHALYLAPAVGGDGGGVVLGGRF